MPEQRIDPKRAVEITGPSYGSGYRIGGRLVLTASHLFTGSVDNACKVRARDNFGEVKARVVWQALGADVALVQLPETVPECDPVVFGRLPAAGQIAATIPFEVYGWPQWARTMRQGERAKAGGRHIRGTIYLADTSGEKFLVLEPERGPEAPKPRAQGSAWTGVSGAAVVCSGLVVAVQHHHQNPDRAASLEAELLSKVYDDPDWRRLLEQHGIHGAPVAVLDESPRRQQAYCARVIKDITSRVKELKDGSLIRKIAREMQQLAGEKTSGIDVGSEPDDLAPQIATCMVEHKAVTDVIGCLIYLMQDLPLDVADKVADIIDVVLPLNYASDVLQHLHTQLAEERFGLVETAVTTPTLAEIIMAGYDQKPARFVVMPDGSAGLRGLTALEYPREPAEGPGDPDSEAANLLPAVRDFLYDLRCLFDVVPDRVRGIQNEAEMHQEIDGHAKWLRGRLRARSQRHRRTIYCVLKLPEASPQRDFRKRILRTISKKLNQEGAALVFVELMAYPIDSRESEVEDHIAYIQNNIRARYLRTQ
jgi:Trypsin-like peptidase domain